MSGGHFNPPLHHGSVPVQPRLAPPPQAPRVNACFFSSRTQRGLVDKPLMRIALYGGTFDPIHHGHLILAREARELLSLDRVLFVPAAQSPFKPGVQSAPAATRLAMIQAATAGEEGLGVDDTEIARGGTSYTIDTVLDVRSRFPGCELFWFIGQDHVRELSKWHRYEELRTLAQFVVFTRHGGAEPPAGFPLITRHVDISATDIRTRVARGLSIRYLVPEAVHLLIVQHRLYLTPT
jgi:nicotinate-nucleotide adenylyltransferase